MRTRLNAVAVVLALVSSLFALQAAAASVVGKIESLQLPAWLDRGGLTVPAAPGIELFAGDSLRTGKGARLLIGLNEGSLVRLGENATFEVTKAERKSGVFTAALAVVEGAFRFTTRAAGKLQARNVSIRVARNATIGIRGTDLWGRGRDDKDIVCLIEGKIDVTGNDDKTSRLDQPLQFFQSTRNAPPEPITFIDPKQLGIWAVETDLEEGRGATEAGQWKLVMSGFATRDAMLAASRNLRNAGYGVEKSAANTLRLDKLASETEAKALGEKLAAEFNLPTVNATK